MVRQMAFERKDTVRILTLDGKISEEEYVVEVEKADRNGFIALVEAGSDRKIKVNQRRVLHNCSDGDAFVIEIGDKYRAVCPKCLYVREVTPSDDLLFCPDHGEIQLSWKKGERPMADATTTEKKETKDVKGAKDTKTSSAEKKTEKTVREPVKVDFDKLQKNSAFELWSKAVRFDHEKVNAQAHVLLITGKNPRKLCFNTYDGALGRKANSLPVSEFVKDSEVDGKKPWYAVKDVEKAKAKLTKAGYEQK